MNAKDYTPALRSTTAVQKRTAEERIAIASTVDGRILAPAPTAGSPAFGAEKSVRESFSMPRADAELIGELMIRSGLQGVPVSSKSSVIRAALRHLAAASPEVLAQVLDSVEPVKHGRK